MSAAQINKLRQQLQEQFPAAHRTLPASEESPFDPAALTFAPGTLHEFVSSHPGSGISLLLSRLLDEEHDLPLALIDGRDSFDPASYGSTKCRRLFWIRCRETMQAIQSADLLLRDGNLPLVLLDLHLTSERELKRIPNAIWHRFRTEARDSGSTLLALTPRPCLPSPHGRVTLDSRFSLNHLELQKPQLQTQATDLRQHHLS
ncbi:MAG: hypothetical protein ACSHYF_01085 [Verrucomicrobiaceae bacterium]